ncbi:membrane protein, putative [uncultured Candidatus Thioglobus sp.]|nr:membrane protein, putative [uncultured Candidatus Thioglobus sp.]SMN00530.1 membrane protein, putative [uncultured Candidatus Thioglobus sp.]
MNTPYQRGFMLSLLILAIGALIWLFSPFIPALFLALLIAIATFSHYQKFKERFSDATASLLMTLLITIILILPLGYILLISGLEISTLIQTINSNFDVTQSNLILQQTLSGLPLSDSIKNTLNIALSNNLDALLTGAKSFTLDILKSIVSLSSYFVFFLIITIFSLYYFYIDGKKIIQQLKDLSPLEDRLNTLLFEQFSSLSITLVGSVFIVALLQGMVFSIGVIIIGLPALFFGIAMALASFIPVLGGLIIWLPLSLYLYAQGQTIDALIIMLFGALLVGTIIDNIIRPMITKKLASQATRESALDHTFITVLSTLAGIIQFGVLGLLIGPIIAAMAISIFDIYKIK